jgi:Domain of unknown function (DUF4105)
MTRLLACILALPATWGCFALWYQVPGGKPIRIIAIALWGLFSVLVLLALYRTRMLYLAAVFVVALALLLIWWHRVLPTNDRLWSDDVAEMTSGSVDGSRVVLHNVRNFDWRSATDYTAHWETRSYDLDHLDSVDMILSYWTIQAIAHVLISFGFDDGQRVVFSVEIRPEKGESFSSVGGFFKEFELSILAADERDVIRVRTNMRGEDDYLYRIRMPKADMRSLFLAYVAQANDLVHTPRFYNTVTVNCTTLIYHMMKRIDGKLPLDYRLLLSGYLPGYVYKVGGLDRRYTLEQLRSFGRITDRARAADRSQTFSADIRRGVPPVLAPEPAPAVR